MEAQRTDSTTPGQRFGMRLAEIGQDATSMQQYDEKVAELLAEYGKETSAQLLAFARLQVFGRLGFEDSIADQNLSPVEEAEARMNHSRNAFANAVIAQASDTARQEVGHG